MNKALKENKRNSLFVTESKFDARGLTQHRVVETGSSSEPPEEAKVPEKPTKMSIADTEAVVILEDPLENEAKEVSKLDLRMTVASP